MRRLWILLPLAFCLYLYWHGLRAWFFQDDFAWLGLLRQVQSGVGLGRALFAPAAQGTMRPISERGYFLLLHWLFGSNALPFRVVVFATQLANLALIAAITRRLTRSYVAAIAAPTLWAANAALVIVMTWSSAYNQALCGFLMLAASWCLLRYAETGRRRFYFAQAALFVLALGAMETAIMYPALAATWCAFYARRLWRGLLPFAGLSAAYVVLHMHWAPKQTQGPYTIRFDAGLFSTFATYWQWALVPPERTPLFQTPAWITAGAAAVFTLAIVVFAVHRTWRHDPLPLMLLAWFALLLAPVLSLPAHISHYYLTLPTIPLAMCAAYGIALEWRIALPLACVFVALSAPVARRMSRWHEIETSRVRSLLEDVAGQRAIHPNDAIVLKGVDNMMFWSLIYDRPFYALGIDDVWLAPGTFIERHPGAGDPSDFILPSGHTGPVREYFVDGYRLREATPR